MYPRRFGHILGTDQAERLRAQTGSLPSIQSGGSVAPPQEACPSCCQYGLPESSGRVWVRPRPERTRCVTVISAQGKIAWVTITAEDVYAAAPYARTLGVEFFDLTGPDLWARLDFDASLSTVSGGLHGGALMGLADVTAAVCAVLNSAAGGAPATTTSATQFLQPVTTDAHAHAVALHVSRSNVVVEVNISDDNDRLCVRVTQTVTVRPARRPD